MSRSETKSPRYLYLLRVRQLDQCPRGDAAAAGGPGQAAGACTASVRAVWGLSGLMGSSIR